MGTVRLRQKDLVFGIYWGDKDNINPGLNVWFRGRYVWPRKRTKGSRKQEQTLPFEVQDGNSGDAGVSVTETGAGA